MSFLTPSRVRIDGCDSEKQEMKDTPTTPTF
jgi:hypothetical protein